MEPLSESTLDRPPSVEITAVSHYAPTRHGALAILNAITLEIKSGEFVAIVGPSGCGKTTLLNMIAGLAPVRIGDVTVDGRPAKAGEPGHSYAFARDALLPWKTALENVTLGLALQKVDKTERQKRGLDVLRRLGLEEFAGSYRSELSQGMRQRVALARTFVSRPRLLLLDEPFGALDAQSRTTMQGLLLRMLAENPATVLLVTHDLREALILADRVVLLSKRPASIRSIVPIPFDSPRSPVNLAVNAEFNMLYSQLWTALSEEETL